MDDPMLKHRFVDAMDAARLCLQDAYNASERRTSDPTHEYPWLRSQAFATMALAQATIAVADRLEAIRELGLAAVAAGFMDSNSRHEVVKRLGVL